MDSRTSTRLRIDPDAALGSLGEGIHHAHAKSRPLAVGFGRKKRFEDVFKHFGWNAHPCVTYCQQDILAGFQSGVHHGVIFV